MSERTETRTDTEGKIDEGRREALKRIGKYAAYTAPLMMVLVAPKSHATGSKPACS